MPQHLQQSHLYDQQVRGRHTQVPKRYEYQSKLNNNITTTSVPNSRNSSRSESLSRPRSQHRLANLLPQLTNEPSQLARLRRETSNASRASSRRTTSPCPSEILLLRSKSNTNSHFNGFAAAGVAGGDSKFPKVYQERNVSETRYPNYVYSNQDNNQHYQQLQAKLNNFQMNGANNNDYIENNPYIPSGLRGKSRQSSLHRTITSTSNHQQQQQQQQLDQGTTSRTSPRSPTSPLKPHPFQTRRKSVAIEIAKPSHLSNNNSDNTNNVGLDSSVEKINDLYKNRMNSTQNLTPATGWKNKPRSPKKRGRVTWRGIESQSESQKHGETSVQVSDDDSSTGSFSESGSASGDGSDRQSTQYMSDSSSLGMAHQSIETGNTKDENDDEVDEDDELVVRPLTVAGILDDGLGNSNETFYLDAIDDSNGNQQLKSESMVNQKNIIEEQVDIADSLNSKPLKSQFRQNMMRDLGYGYRTGHETGWRSLLKENENTDDANTNDNVKEPIMDNSLNSLIESDGIHVNNKAKNTVDMNLITATTASEKMQYEEIYKEFKNLKLFGQRPMMDSIERVQKRQQSQSEKRKKQQMAAPPYGGMNGSFQEFNDCFPSSSTVATSLLAADARMSQTRSMLSFPFGGGAGGYTKRVQSLSGGDDGGVITDVKNKHWKGKINVQGAGGGTGDVKKDLSSYLDKNGKFKLNVGDKIVDEMWNSAWSEVTKS
ncbi:unnamed protein product [Ambrosiozyma monospora]|uniref:Unnamed protein product n=1 Tax=Ambrosiozyma monospora TaxID=43982 RepID=A0ACB5T0W7_AMBMO|nr:unnamed protein product [Ambrosiozyma monospora]